MDSRHFYTDEKNAQIVIALLKAHGIRKVVANPGATNIPFTGSVQNDPWFQVYSGVDERHSAYLAVGMAAESGEPVVLSCTAATASRNYLPALTEAYYRKLPILALTSLHHLNATGNLLPQMIDRSSPPKDAIRHSLRCPVPHTEREVSDCVSNVNKAILELFRHGGGPVHIDLETERTFTYGTKTLPDVRVIRRISPFDHDWPEIDANWKILIWIGSHKHFTDEETEAISKFVRSHDVVVLTDKTSGNYTGAGAVHSGLLLAQDGAASSPACRSLRPDLTIQIGEVSGDYPAAAFVGTTRLVWRVCPDGEGRDLFNKLVYVFEMPESVFFAHYATEEDRRLSYAADWQSAEASLFKRIPELPFGNVWIAAQLHDKLPAGSEIHLGILNSLRSWNLFPLPKGVTSSSNVGGFGIDGCISTMIGASLAAPEKLFFGVFGDLAFFYDLNAIGNRHVGKNLRILIVNNTCGAEFTLAMHPAAQFGKQTLDYLAAGRHFGNGSRALVKHFAEDLGFRYLAATDKESFLRGRDEFLSPEGDKPVLFECFTHPKDESDAIDAVRRILEPDSRRHPVISFSSRVKAAVPRRIKNAVKELIR